MSKHNRILLAVCVGYTAAAALFGYLSGHGAVACGIAGFIGTGGGWLHAWAADR